MKKLFCLLLQPLFLNKITELVKKKKVSKKVEFLYVDDGSRDGTWKIINELSKILGISSDELLSGELKEVEKKDLATKFAELAKENSDDEATKKDGGSLGKINKDTLDSNYDELVDAAYETKDGALYGKVITSELGYHIILKTKSYALTNFSTLLT